MARFFYRVIKDGQVIGTRSSDREYTHAVVRWNPPRVVHDQVAVDRHVGHIEYCGRLDLARKKVKGPNFEIIGLTVTETEK